MNAQKQSKHIGRKVWYVVAIALSAIVIVFGAIGVVGTWVGGRALSRATVSILGVVSNTAGSVRQVDQRIDQAASQILQVSATVSSVSNQISQNVSDKGLLVTLLPPEQEQKLAESISSIQNTFSTIRDVLGQVIQLYTTINKIPCVNLPAPSSEQLTKVEQAVDKGKANVATLRQGVQDFRSGAAARIDTVTQAADQVTQAMNDLRSRLAEIDSDLASLQALMTRLQQIVPTIFILLAILVTIFLVYLIYTQVEMIRLYVQRWHLLGVTPASLPAEDGTAIESETNPPD